MVMAVVEAAGEAGRVVAGIGHDVGKLWSAKRGGSEQKKAVMNHGLSQDNWWRRRESNPRPQALCRRFYMRILSIVLTGRYPTGREDGQRSLERF